MKIYKYLLVFLVSFVTYSQDFSQDWTGHFSYARAFDFAEGNDVVYVAVENAVYLYSTLDSSIQTLTTINGLSGNTISSIHYSLEFDRLFIGYENGIIDVLSNNATEVLTIVDIFNRVSITPDRKRINNFEEFNGFVYISTGFGISLFDLDRLEFEDSYFIGDGGSLLNVGSIAIFGAYIYAATTDGGLRRAIVDNDNIIDFNNWQTIETGSYESITSFSGSLYLQEGNTILRSTSGLNYQLFEQFSENITQVRASEDFLDITLLNAVLLFNESGIQVNSFVDIPGYSRTYTSSIVVNGNVFVGTVGTAVANFAINTPNDLTRLLPNGPLENDHFDIAASAGSIWTVFGNYDVFYDPFPLRRQGVSHFIEGEGWDNIAGAEFFEAANLSYVTIDPEDSERVFVSSFNSGLIELIESIPTIIYDENNSSLEAVVREDGVTDDVRVGDSAFDRDGNLWVVNSRVPVGLHRVTPGGQFTGFNTEDVISSADTNLDNIVITSDGNLFIGSDDSGIIAFNPTTNNFVTIAGEDGAANLPINDIRSLALDRNGTLWIGTRLGLRVLFGPSQVFENSDISTNEIVILQDGLPQELLNDQVVTDIVVDGANNKWLATADSGVFYVSPNGQETIFHFTTDNSPLPSNSVQAVAIDPQTGSIYFGTNQGMVSFNGSSTAPAENLEEVLVYPNPVRPGFAGNVRIENLTDQTNVKIVDVVGNLVYEENTTGGSIEWDTTAFGRHKVASGVYLILITGPPDEQQETAIKKVMIIR